MQTYVAYGLGIRSDLELPELVVGDRPAEVVVRRGAVEFPESSRTGAGSGLVATSDDIRFWLGGVGTFLVRDGRSIRVEAAPDAADDLLRPAILGPAMGLLLHQRGLATFHGSSLCVDGLAAIFLGAKGAGKSTLAAALYERGHPLVADDISAVHVVDGRMSVLPGYPTFKLWPDSARALGIAPDELEPLHGQTDKLLMPARKGFPDRPVPLGAVYVLTADDGGAEDAFRRLRPASGLLELLPHWYAAMSGLPLIRTLGLSVHLRQCAEIAAAVPVFHLLRTLPFAAPAETTEQVVTHFRNVMHERNGE